MINHAHPSNNYFYFLNNAVCLWRVDCCQHASNDVEKMILANKCDMNDRRQVSLERGTAVSFYFLL